MKTFCPVYEKDGHELIVLTKDFVADNHEEAWKIGMGSMLVECIILGMKYKEVREIDTEHLPHRKATLGGLPVALIAGPAFDEVAAGTPYEVAP